jgi:hypothetical protein
MGKPPLRRKSLAPLNPGFFGAKKAAGGLLLAGISRRVISNLVNYSSHFAFGPGQIQPFRRAAPGAK